MVDTQEVWNVANTRSPTEVETEYEDMAESVPIRKLTLQQIKSATEVDAELQALGLTITQGWPERSAEVPFQLQAHFPFREELSIQDGVVFKGECIVVPSSLRQCMMNKVHASHLGIQGCLRRAKEAFYWPGIYKQITEFISKCSICNSHKPEQQKQLARRCELEGGMNCNEVKVLKGTSEILNDHGRASQQTCLSAMVLST